MFRPILFVSLFAGRLGHVQEQSEWYWDSVCRRLTKSYDVGFEFSLLMTFHSFTIFWQYADSGPLLGDGDAAGLSMYRVSVGSCEFEMAFTSMFALG